jgi:membrane-associated protease RseP (regulator of RpoE activity)
LGILNLLPIREFDGGRILGALLCRVGSQRAAQKTVNALSFFCVFTLWSFSVYLLLRFAASLSLFVFSISLFFKLFIRET